MYPTKPLHQFKISVILISSDKFQRNKVSVRCRLNVRRLLCMKGRMFSIFQPLVLLTFPDMTKIRPFLHACVGFCPSSLCPLFIKPSVGGSSRFLVTLHVYYTEKCHYVGQEYEYLGWTRPNGRKYSTYLSFFPIIVWPL